MWMRPQTTWWECVCFPLSLRKKAEELASCLSSGLMCVLFYFVSSPLHKQEVGLILRHEAVPTSGNPRGRTVHGWVAVLTPPCFNNGAVALFLLSGSSLLLPG